MLASVVGEVTLFIRVCDLIHAELEFVWLMNMICRNEDGDAFVAQLS